MKPSSKKPLDLTKVKPPEGGTGVAPKLDLEGKEPDRAWLSMERKFKVVDYESFSISLGATSSCNPGESIGEATNRIWQELKAEYADIIEVMREEEGF